MYIEKEVLIKLYQDFMNRMDDDLEVADDFKGPLSDDYMEGIHSGLTVAQEIFRDCYKQACRK
ncbi:MAG: hypothetical protein M1461_13065 [Nitrospirae bacterium]|nr:hypothetical protein [Nitrospirota bacterium]